MRIYISGGQTHGSMVSTQQNTVSSASTELLTLGRPMLLFKHTITQISSCGTREEILTDKERDCKEACGRCNQVHELLSLVAEGQDEVTIRGVHWSHTLTFMMCKCQLRVATTEAGPEPGLCQERGNITRDKEEG